MDVTGDMDDIDAGYFTDAAPLAVDDDYTTPQDTPVSANVLDNDSDADGDVLTAALDSGPAYGSITLNPDGSFTYTPPAGWTGTTSFTYTAGDGHGGIGEATVTITVYPPPPPVTINGKVWQDGWVYYGYPYDGDGIQQSDYSDAGMPNVVVHLLDATGQEVASTTTDE